MNKSFLTSSLIIAVLFMPLSYGATTDGALGANSTGNIDLDLQVLDSVQISALDTVDFATYGGADTGGRVEGDAYCVYVNGGGNYHVTPTTTNGSFVLSGAVYGDTIPYSLRIAGTATGAATAPPAIYNFALLPFPGSSSLTCGGANNASLDVSIAEQDIRDATTDLYSDTLILLISPI